VTAVTEDRRVRRTKAALQQALVELVVADGYEAISIDAVASRRGHGQHSSFDFVGVIGGVADAARDIFLFAAFRDPEDGVSFDLFGEEATSCIFGGDRNRILLAEAEHLDDRQEIWSWWIDLQGDVPCPFFQGDLMRGGKGGGEGANERYKEEESDEGQSLHLR
jgi:hypothetical protein